MKAKAVIAGAFLFALVLMALSSSYAFGCIPDPEDPSRCAETVSIFRPTAVAISMLQPAPVAPRPTPRGDSPATARSPLYVRPVYCIEAMCPGALNAPAFDAPSAWTWIEANTSTWYKMDDGHSLQIQLWLFANGQNGMTFDVYAPDQNDLNGRPIGRGSFNPSQRPADLFYSGRTQAGGTWHVRVTNNNSAAVPYVLKFTRTTPAIGNVCDGCHRPLGSLMFDQCTDGAGSSWCQDLGWLYGQDPTTYDHSIPGK